MEPENNDHVRKPQRRYEKDFEQPATPDDQGQAEAEPEAVKPVIYTDITSDTGCQGASINIDKSLHPANDKKRTNRKKENPPENDKEISSKNGIQKPT